MNLLLRGKKEKDLKIYKCFKDLRFLRSFAAEAITVNTIFIVNATPIDMKTVKIIVPNEMILKKVNSTPTFSRLSRLKLKVGENIENVNHTQFSNMKRLYPLIGVNIEEFVKS